MGPPHVRRKISRQPRKGSASKMARTDIPPEAGAIRQNEKGRVVTFRPGDCRDTNFRDTDFRDNDFRDTDFRDNDFRDNDIRDNDMGS